MFYLDISSFINVCWQAFFFFVFMRYTLASRNVYSFSLFQLFLSTSTCVCTFSSF
jgi:hypothetical protein